MQYMLLMVEQPQQRGTRTEDEGKAVYGRMVAFAEELKGRGVLRGVESLQSHERATRVQVREGRAQLLDGPFAEAKEHLGGYVIVECESIERAVEIAKRWPHAGSGAMEVRPIMDTAGAEM